MKSSEPRRFDKYDRRGGFHWQILKHEHYRGRIDAILEYVRPAYHCLDLGCGDGAFMSRVAPRCAHLTGVDIEKRGIEIARAKLSEMGIANVKLVHSDFKDVLPGKRVQPRAFDLVYAMDVIEHLTAPSELLALADSAMKPDGRFLVGTPLFVNRENVSKYHVKEYTFPDLIALVAKRFRVVSIRRLPDKLKTGGVCPDRFALVALKKRP